MESGLASKAPPHRLCYYMMPLVGHSMCTMKLKMHEKWCDGHGKRCTKAHACFPAANPSVPPSLPAAAGAQRPRTAAQNCSRNSALMNRRKGHSRSRRQRESSLYIVRPKRELKAAVAAAQKPAAGSATT